MFAAWGRDHQAGYAGDAGRHKHVRHGERAVFAAATFFPPFARRVGSSGARELRAFSPLVARAAGFGADDRREPPPRARGQRPECLLRQRRGLVPEPGRDHRRRERALPRVGAAAMRARLGTRAGGVAGGLRRKRTRARLLRARRAAAALACARNWKKHERGKGEGQDDDAFVSSARRSVHGGSRRFAAVAKQKKNRAPPSESRDGTRREKAAASRGCRVSGNGGSLAARTPARGAWGRNMARPDMARPVPSRARGVDRAARWRARAWGRASRGAPLEPRAGRGPRSTRRKTTMSGDTHLSVRGLGVGGRARARKPPCGARWDRLPRACAPGSSGACTGSRSGGRARL